MTKEQIKEYSLKITQANSTALVRLTLEIAAKYIGDAINNVEKETEFRSYVSKARAMVAQLISSLDMKYKISHELLNIYLFINNQLQKASIRKDISLLPRIKGITESLSSAFGEIEEEDKGGALMQNTQQVYAGLTYSKGQLNENMYSDTSRGYTV